MQKIFKVSALTLAMSLAACGGGGGSPGVTEESYKITLRADKTQLPINVANTGAGIGVYAPYSTTLYVDASIGGRPIPGGEEGVFGCNVAGGLDSGSLYYLDGKEEHEVEIDDGNGGTIKVPGSYRSITLGSNSGGNSFHFHAGDAAGTARITCTVTDPRDKQQKSAYVDINVGSATKKPASVRVESSIPNKYYYLGTKNNTVGLQNQMALVAFLLDDANQPVAGSSAPNLQVSIASSSAAASGARLVANGQSGNVIQLKTGVTGTAQFSLISGDETGPVLLEFTADRHDNNVQNGIVDAISALDKVSVIEDYSTPLSASPVDLGTLTNGVEFIYALEGYGGLPPYTWSVTGLPKGLTADASGVIKGIPEDKPVKYRAKAIVTDKNKLTAVSDVTVTLVDGINKEDFSINGCYKNTTDINTSCRLPSAQSGSSYIYAFSASVSGVNWSFEGLPSWLSGGTAGSNGYISGTPKNACGENTVDSFFVTAEKGAMSVTRKVSIAVNAEPCPTEKPEPPVTPILDVVPSSLVVPLNETRIAKIVGGSGSYQAFSSEESSVTVSLNGSELTVKAIAPLAGFLQAQITILDLVTLRKTYMNVDVR